MTNYLFTKDCVINLQNLVDPFATLDSLLCQLQTTVGKENLNQKANGALSIQFNAVLSDLEMQMDQLFQIGGFAIACTKDQFSMKANTIILHLLLLNIKFQNFFSVAIIIIYRYFWF